jgi:fatty acid-binding protein DegV
VCNIQTADTLKGFHLGGWIGMAQQLLGSMLNIKPLIGMEEGIITLLGRVYSRGQAYQTMADMICDAVGQGQAKIAYVHAGALREAERIRTLVESKVPVGKSLVVELSPSLAVHTSPGTAGVCYYKLES